MAHSKKFLAPHAEAHFKDIQKAAGLLAMVPSTNVERYQVWALWYMHGSRARADCVA
jgi:hypothetical protein